MKGTPKSSANTCSGTGSKSGLTGKQVNGFRGETDTREKMEQRVNCDLLHYSLVAMARH
jgi:hypothetical protein